MNFLIGLFVSFPCFLLRAFLHGGGGPQIGEATCGASPHMSCKRDQIKKRDFMDRRVPPPRRVDIVTGSFLDFFGSHVFWYVFPRIIVWYIFLVSCSKGGWLATQSTPLPLDPPLILQSFLSFSGPVHHSKSVLLRTRTLSTLSVRTSVSKNLFLSV